ncbi:unnamed protein product [Urochloa decumbens]|uniref:Uncharacterized protein n=1 Tax=Urochloa decumbens TaxID=240449 RepID=A0ABC8WAX4_9POAL
MMGLRLASYWSALLLVLNLLLPLCANADTKIYIAYMGEKKHDDPAVVSASHHDTLSSILGSKDEALKSIVYSYKHGFSGFAAKLTSSQAEQLKKYPGVVSVKPNTYYKLQTTRSWDFLGVNYYQPSGLLKKANYGKDVIVGVVDSGIWPESRSFDDTGYSPMPKRWKGICQGGQAFNATSCNRKIIGARWYKEDVDLETIDTKREHMSPRDANGHGTHCASTIAGVPVRNASHHGGRLGAGMVRGGAPHARLAVYKACWSKKGGGTTCSDAAVLMSMDDAVHDGVDVLSLSLGGLTETVGSLHLVARGITLVFGAGNNGPVPGTVLNASPWVISVAASTIDRSYPTEITLGNGEKLVGQSYYDNDVSALNSSDFHSLVDAGSCTEKEVVSANVTGKVAMCFAPLEAAASPPSAAIISTLVALYNAKAKGMIFAQYTNNLIDSVQLNCKNLGMACVLVDYQLGYRIIVYGYILSSDSSPVVKISPTKSIIGNGVLSPRVAWFSGRGPSVAFPAILKPDITAPGVSVLAAKGDSYEFMSGTSMACPHVSAVAVLIKSVHPGWSPAMIKSAIVTTASVTDRFGMPIQAEGVPSKVADPFDFGGGHINPERAVDPGLVYDINPKEYTKFFNCTLEPDKDCTTDIGKLYFLNLPSIAVPDLKDSITVWRTVTNVGPAKAIYRAMIQAPAGVIMSVDPSVITFKKGGRQSATFKVTFKARQRVQGAYTFGSLTWFDDRKHSVRIPIAVRTIVQDFMADIS